ncbi:MAG: hypothetical protein HAW63_00795 [Bdellovibrionaceae bacterium]|nr:hypothetical protein [Pseudobdellovibrionaceae bacterium]
MQFFLKHLFLLVLFLSIQVSSVFASTISAHRIPVSLLEGAGAFVTAHKIKNLPMFLDQTYKTDSGDELSKQLILKYMKLTKNLYVELDKNSSYKQDVATQDFLYLWEVFDNQKSNGNKETLNVLVKKLLQKKFINNQFLNSIKNFHLTAEFINNEKKKSKIPIGSFNFFISGIISSLPISGEKKKRLFKNSHSTDILPMLKNMSFDKNKFDKTFRYSDFGFNSNTSYEELLLIAEKARAVEQKMATISILSFLYSKQAITITNGNVEVIEKVFPKNFNSFLKKVLSIKEDKLLIKSTNKIINSYGESKSVKNEFKMALLQVPAFISTYRGCIGGDCSTKTTWANSYHPYEYIFYILNKQKKAIGYMSVDLVKVNNDLVLYVKDITGANLSAKHVDWALHTLFINKDAFKAKYLTLAQPEWFNGNSSFPTVKEAMSKYNQSLKIVNQTFFAIPLQEEVLKKQKNSEGSYDDFKKHRQGVVFSPNQKIINSFKTQVKENPFLKFSFFSEKTMKKAQWKFISVNDAIDVLFHNPKIKENNLLLINEEANKHFSQFLDSADQGNFKFSAKDIINAIWKEGVTEKGMSALSRMNWANWPQLFFIIDSYINKGQSVNNLAKYILSKPEVIAHHKWAGWIDSYINKGQAMEFLGTYVLSKPEVIAHPKWTEWIDSYIKKGKGMDYLALHAWSKPEAIVHPKWIEWIDSYIKKGEHLKFLALSVLFKPRAIAHPKWAGWIDSYIKKGEGMHYLAYSVLSKSEVITHPKWAGWIDSYIKKGEGMHYLAVYVLSKPEVRAHSKWIEWIDSYIKKGKDMGYLAVYALSKPKAIAHPKWTGWIDSYIKKGKEMGALAQAVLSHPEVIAHPKYQKLLLLFIKYGGLKENLYVIAQKQLVQALNEKKQVMCRGLFN